MRRHLGLLLVVAFAWSGTADVTQAATKIVLIAGKPSHGAGEHEFNAGTKLLVQCLKEMPGVEPVLVTGGWPEDESIFQGAKSVVFYMDGGPRHPMIQSKERLEVIRRLMAQGVGLACLHYAVEYPKQHADDILDWLGGYYETGYSVNPHNDVQVSVTSGHPITRGVPSFRALDEWYYKIRFRPGDARVTPILTGKDLADRQGNKTTDPQTFAWATERQDGGRSFGFTGAHFHRNWGIPAFRTLVLNAILWTAHLEVPASGAGCNLGAKDLQQNLDPKPAPKKRGG